MLLNRRGGSPLRRRGCFLAHEQSCMQINASAKKMLEAFDGARAGYELSAFPQLSLDTRATYTCSGCRESWLSTCVGLSIGPFGACLPRLKNEVGD